MAKHTLKILRCKHRKIFKVCLAIFQHYAIKGYLFSYLYLPYLLPYLCVNHFQIQEISRSFQLLVYLSFCNTRNLTNLFSYLCIYLYQIRDVSNIFSLLCVCLFQIQETNLFSYLLAYQLTFPVTCTFIFSNTRHCQGIIHFVRTKIFEKTSISYPLISFFWDHKAPKCSFSSLWNFSDCLFEVTAAYIFKIIVNYFLG